MWGYYLQVPERALASVLVDDQERQLSGWVPFGKVHPEVRAARESRLAGLLPPPLFELVQQSGNSSIQAVYSSAPRSYARDRLCLVGDAGAVFPPFAGSGVLRAVAGATSLSDALAGAPAVDDALRRWSEAQLQVAALAIPNAEGIERSHVFGLPGLTTMPTTATNHWMSAASRAPGHPPRHVTWSQSRRRHPSPLHSGRRGGAERSLSRYPSGGQCSGGHTCRGVDRVLALRRGAHLVLTILKPPRGIWAIGRRWCADRRRGGSFPRFGSRARQRLRPAPPRRAVGCVASSSVSGRRVDELGAIIR